jgi:Tol biopolymer transport system component
MPDISPDGQWVAYSSGGKQENIFVIRVDGAELHKLTDGIHKDRMPRWSPDGETDCLSRIAAAKWRFGASNPMVALAAA